MLVIVSDLHLTDGSAGASIVSGALRLLADRVREMAIAASWRAGGEYRPLERIDVLLLGDVLDLLTSRRWVTEQVVKPWSDPADSRFVDLVTRITSDVLRHNHDRLAPLRSLAGEGGLTVPPADASGRPAQDAEPQPIAVGIHYLVGDHDWPLHLVGSSYDFLRQSVAGHLGLANPHGRPFPHDPVESEELLELERRHRVVARHGDHGDVLALGGARGAASLTDTILTALVVRFVQQAQVEMAGQLPAALLSGLGELQYVRPLPMVAVWLDGLLNRTCPLSAERRAAEAAWDRLAEALLEMPPVRNSDRVTPQKLVEGLSSALLFCQRPAKNWSNSVASWLRDVNGLETESMYSHALAEADFRNRRAKHVVYGHTHVAETVPLEASYSGSYPLNQIFFNTGCWRRVYRPTAIAPAGNEFVAADTVNCLAFYRGDERGGRPFESWSAMLGPALAGDTIHRLDGETRVGAPHRAFTTAAPATSGPHFATAVQRPKNSGSRKPQ